MPEDSDLRFYGKFLEHATDAALDNIAVSLEDVHGVTMDERLHDELRSILLDVYSQLQRQRTIGTLDQDATNRIMASILTHEKLNATQSEAVHGEVLKAILGALADFGRSMTDFLDDVIRERNQ